MGHVLSTSVRELKGVGDKGVKAFARLGILTFRDLLCHYPRGYEDRTRLCEIASLEDGISQTVQAVVTTPAVLIRLHSGRIMVRTEISDDTGSMTLVFFNRDYIKNFLRTGEKYFIYGKPDEGKFTRSMTNPEISKADSEYTGAIVPVYPSGDGLNQNLIRRCVREVLSRCVPYTEDPLPESVINSHNLAGAVFAYENIHFPSSAEVLETARERLIFSEFFILSAALSLIGKNKRRSCASPYDTSFADEFISGLPFKLTDAQFKVLRELFADLISGNVMNRLIQGDVGSGKTVVAAVCVYIAIKNGHQAAIMAPTEILAAQHYKSFKAFLEPCGIRCALLTSSSSPSEKKRILAGLSSGEIDFVSGTHAVIEASVSFFSLGLVVCDEQHRFGVDQRSALTDKGSEVHTIVMSATPIPRTLALVMYGDLDVSIIDELPPGRKPVETYAVNENYRERLYNFIKKIVSGGSQVYIVCPLVEENDSLELKSVVEYAGHLSRDIFPELKVGLLHGRMKAAEKTAVMNSFIAGDTHILVSTTVIEVGIDVPNAALMIIENAERFGLSQLHQLRGRVGRGADKSYCVLISDTGGKSRERLEVMCKTTDGFKIAEADLALRGPGDFFGKKQHGLPELRIASFTNDVKILYEAQNAAAEVLRNDPDLSKDPNSGLMRAVNDMTENLRRS